MAFKRHYFKGHQPRSQFNADAVESSCLSERIMSKHALQLSLKILESDWHPAGHSAYMHIISQLSLSGFVINWICSFLSGRGQLCKINGLHSNVIEIGLSIVQGSGIGPTLYIVTKNDLRTVSAVNDIFKYANDTTLIGSRARWCWTGCRVPKR